MYRAITLYFLRNHIDWTDKKEVKEALKNINVSDDSSTADKPVEYFPLILYYHPVLQQSFRNSINGALRSALQLVQSKYIVQKLYTTVNEQNIPDSLENQMTSNQLPVNEIPVSRDGSRNVSRGGPAAEEAI